MASQASCVKLAISIPTPEPNPFLPPLMGSYIFYFLALYGNRDLTKLDCE